MREVLSVMVVDDHAAILEHVGRWVARSGVAEVVAVCQDPLEAVLMWSRVRPDVLLTDLQMPGLDGLGLTKQVLAADPRAVVVVFSAQTRHDIEAVCRGAGAAGFIPKSATPDELAVVLRAVTDGRGESTPH